MSGGEQQMLDHRAHADGQSRRCVLLDEPSEGLAPVIVEQMATTILRPEARRPHRCCCPSRTCTSPRAVADRALIIEKGRIRFAGTMAELMADEGVRASI